MSIVVYRRLSSGPSPSRELLDVADDGAWTGWRSRGSAVGRFGGRVDETDTVRALADAAAVAPVPEAGQLAPDGSYERVIAGEAQVVLRAGDTLAGPWGELVAWCRRLVDAMPGDPDAAVAAVVLAVRPPNVVRVEHRGSEALPLELGSLAVRAGSAPGRPPATTRPAIVPELHRVDAGPGWSIELEVPGLLPAAGDRVTAWAEVVVDDGGAYIPVALTAHATVD